MAIVEVKCPQLSESVAEATLLQWKKRPGERVEMDEILVEIETDKVVLEVPAPAAGVMAQLVKNDGETCIAEEVIAKIDTEGRGAVSPLDVKPVPEAVPAPGATPGVKPEPAPDAATRTQRRRCRPPRRSWPTTAFRPARCPAPARTAASPRATCSRRWRDPARSR